MQSVWLRSRALGRKARSQQQRIRSLASLHILVPGPDDKPFTRPKDSDLVALRRQPQAAAALLASAYPQVSDRF